MSGPITVRRPPLLEREGELAVAEAAAGAARDGTGSVLLVAGPPGSGKSALLRELPSIAEVERMTVLRAGGARLEREFTCGVIGQLLNPVLYAAPAEVRDSWLTGTAGRVCARPYDGSAVNGLIRRDIPHRQLLAGLDALLANISADRGPLLVLADDVHYADEPSLRWLAHLAQHVQHLPVLLVCAIRDGDALADEPLVRQLAEAATTTVRPRPLSAAAVLGLVNWHTGAQADEEFGAACLAVTGGNPMFLAAVLDELAAEEVAPVAANRDRVYSARPVRLRDWLLACLRSQPPPVWEVAKAITVLGERADLDLIGRLTGLDEVAGELALRTLSRFGLLVERTPRFAQVLVREALDESMTVEERERAHVRAAEELHLSGRPAEEVADRLLGVLSVRLPWAAEALRGAADAAIRRGAPEAAVRYLRRLLLDDTLDDDDRAAAYVALATAEVGVDRAASVRHVAQATALLSAPRDRAAALVRLSPALFADAPPYVRDLLDEVMAQLGKHELTGGDRELALHLEARARHVGSADPAELMASAWRLRGFGPDPAVATPAERELLTVLLYATTKVSGSTAAEVAGLGARILRREPATPSHVHGVLPLLVDTLCAADSVDELSAWLDSALEQCLDNGGGVERDLIDAERALVALNRGRLAEAGEIAHRVLAGPPPDWARTGTAILVPLSLTAINNRDPELIRRLLADPPEEGANVLVNGLLGLLRGTAAAIEGDRESALAFILDTGWQLERAGWRNPGLFSWRLSAAVLHKRLGDPEAAREIAEQELLRAHEWGAAAAIGRASRVAGDMTPGPAGLALLREAVDVLEKSANRSELARALVRLGKRAKETEPDEAADHLARAREIALDCGDAIAERSARLAGERRAGAGTLTPAEGRVVELAAAGNTNQEIAKSLEVSVRAVEKHLTNSYRKLGVKRRTELAGALRARTW
ncbi:AAA family ATPase [Amycolatopsis sp. YIM 10]|uniref:ATP-binding protein n=1 Tax=Amycolatopsis sp. YIM 10 TaxID=2653857 RepID=UPI001290865D|nr:AAA family ATPase [Amycolatopsis sp. YIM 10]QFU90323.1 Putative HTH-type transcriptional regulator [Amycolatopsis sp. YIM 10]